MRLETLPLPPAAMVVYLDKILLQAEMIELGLADGSLIDELMELTAQSLARLEIQEHFDIVKEIGRGKYGKVLLVTHRFRGAAANDKHGKCSFLKTDKTEYICSLSQVAN